MKRKTKTDDKRLNLILPDAVTVAPTSPQPEPPDDDAETDRLQVVATAKATIIAADKANIDAHWDDFLPDAYEIRSRTSNRGAKHVRGQRKNQPSGYRNWKKREAELCDQSGLSPKDLQRKLKEYAEKLPLPESLLAALESESIGPEHEDHAAIVKILRNAKIPASAEEAREIVLTAQQKLLARKEKVAQIAKKEDPAAEGNDGSRLQELTKSSLTRVNAGNKQEAAEELTREFVAAVNAVLPDFIFQISWAKRETVADISGSTMAPQRGSAMTESADANGPTPATATAGPRHATPIAAHGVSAAPAIASSAGKNKATRVLAPSALAPSVSVQLPNVLAGESLDCLHLVEQPGNDGRFGVAIDYERLDQIKKSRKVKTYLVGGEIDLFGPQVGDKVVDEVLGVIRKKEQSEFRIESPNLDRALAYAESAQTYDLLWCWPINLRFGVAVRCPKDLALLDILAQIKHEDKWVSFAEYRPDPSSPLNSANLISRLRKCRLREIVIDSGLVLSSNDAEALAYVASTTDWSCSIVDLHNHIPTRKSA